MIAAMFVDPNDPQRVFDEFEEIGAARKRGRELWGHVGCFPLGMEFTLRHPYPLEALLAWRPAIEAEGSEQYPARAGGPEFRTAVKAEALSKERAQPLLLSQPGAHDDHGGEAGAASAAWSGRNVAQLARAEGKDPFDWFLDFGLDGELDAMVDCKLFNTDERRGARSDPASARARSRCPTPARTWRSCATRASACTCSGTGRASAAT